MIKVVLVDDEPGNMELMQEMLQQYCKQVHVCGSATTIKEAARLIRLHAPALVFLDVEMKNETGFNLFEQFTNPAFQVIFVTAHEKYALQAIRSSCLGYLLKPVDYKELIAAVDKFEKQHQLAFTQKQVETLLDNINGKKHQVSKIAIPTTGGLVFINTNEIICCEASGNYTIISTAGERIISSKTLKEYEQMLTGSVFFRCHKSFLINLDLVKKFSRTDGFRVQMQNEAWIDIAVRKKDEFISIFEKR